MWLLGVIFRNFFFYLSYPPPPHTQTNFNSLCFDEKWVCLDLLVWMLLWWFCFFVLFKKFLVFVSIGKPFSFYFVVLFLSHESFPFNISSASYSIRLCKENPMVQWPKFRVKNKIRNVTSQEYSYTTAVIPALSMVYFLGIHETLFFIPHKLS